MGYKIHGYKEVIFSVRDIDRDLDVYSKLGGWTISDRNQLSKSQLSFWNLGSEVKGETALLTYPGRDSGIVRLVSFKNVKQKHIRAHAQSWDTGGIYDVDIRVKDVRKKTEEFQYHGWSGYSDIKEYHFNEFHVSEILIKGSEDIVFALIQRHAPLLEGYPMLKEMSHVFNSSQIVKSLEESKIFYIDTLGFQEYSTFEGRNGKAGPNVFGIPYNVFPEVVRKISILSPTGKNEGSIELVELEGLTGRDFSQDAVAPNLGILTLRFPVKGLSEFVETMQEKGLVFETGIERIEMDPYGNVDIAAIKSPDGAWLEFMEIVES